ncbi:YjbH domain-containing protein [Aliivibrio salmonicida]|uniref:Outer membrane protein n=1 Tax=Aliivibrio salmonicida (strain LFI1238) TaxID=316275 RepID=B6EPH7_ALISL|nr:YjbH domain-containing protein [Aliivibrio salmonicida]AZL83735.1 YjbH domain-containing protein [Aliivibrio salmonicida]CAQ77957.1 putative outer membrane protein [Aliivibrio salmonicida LFI1238]
MPYPKFALSLIASAITATFSTFSLAAESSEYIEPITFTPSQTDFGGVGLMQMPSGRNAEEGTFSFNTSFNNEYHFYNLSLQLMPWLETTIRYTLTQDMKYSSDPSFSGDTTHADKGIDFKVRLLEESDWLPETSIGVRDFGGTGLFDGEFVAATKRFGNLDVTVGMGWGYLGQSGNITNPFCKASDKYCSRESDFKGNGGSVDFERWFKGSASLYGGLEYQTPFQPLRLKLEYDGNDYSQDYPVKGGVADMTQHTPWNFGVLYGLGDWGDMRLSYERGDTLTFGFTLTTNFNTMKANWRDTPETVYQAPSVNHVDEINWNYIEQELDNNAGYSNSKFYVKGNELTIVTGQEKYRNKDIAHQEAAAILASNTPEYIQTYRIIEENNSLLTTETVIDAERYKDAAQFNYVGAKITDATVTQDISETDSINDDNLKHDSFDRWDVNISPSLRQSIGGAEGFYLYEIGIKAGSSYWLTDNLQASGSLYLNLIDNYDKFNYIAPPDATEVPRVRTMFRAYATESALRLERLQLTWFDEYAEGLYGQTYGGYLESMFGGVGTEILYRPINSRWAVGLDYTYIQQRSPDNWFDFYQDDRQYSEADGRYYNVRSQGTTGHLTGYYMPQWSFLKSTLLKVSYGEFLAGDKGYRVDFSKQFDSGVIVGAYASMTDLSAEEFGEGSYTKGFYLSIPYDIMTVKPSKNRAYFDWQPLTRDGGQMLSKENTLFGLTDARQPWYTKKGL